VAEQEDFEIIHRIHLPVKQIREREDKYLTKIKEISNSSLDGILEHGAIEYDPASFTWRQLYLKLCLEHLLSEQHHHEQFHKIYEFVNAFQNEIISLKFKIISTE